MRTIMYDMIFSDVRSTDDDVDAAVDDLSVQGKDCFVRTCIFVNKS
jgi:hypothetical protein